MLLANEFVEIAWPHAIGKRTASIDGFVGRNWVEEAHRLHCFMMRAFSPRRHEDTKEGITIPFARCHES